MDIIFLVAKICHTTTFADFGSNNYGQGIQYLEPGKWAEASYPAFYPLYYLSNEDKKNSQPTGHNFPDD
jgi:hypothetical protein